MMLLRESGFTFAGRHCRYDYGMIYAEKDGHPAIPRIRRNEYEIAGMSGTILMPGEQWEPIRFEGMLYPAIERNSQREAQTLIRSVASWLTSAGRNDLIFDYEPTKLYKAELSAESKWSIKNWFGGELSVCFEAQPFAYATAYNSATIEAVGTGASITVNVSTGVAAPFIFDVMNIGGTVMTGLKIGSSIEFAGMALSPGQTLTVSCEPPILATIGQTNAMRYITKFAPIYASNGPNSVNIRMTYATSGTNRTQITARALGRW